MYIYLYIYIYICIRLMFTNFAIVWGPHCRKMIYKRSGVHIELLVHRRVAWSNSWIEPNPWVG